MIAAEPNSVAALLYGNFAPSITGAPAASTLTSIISGGTEEASPTDLAMGITYARTTSGPTSCGKVPTHAGGYGSGSAAMALPWPAPVRPAVLFRGSKPSNLPQHTFSEYQYGDFQTQRNPSATSSTVTKPLLEWTTTLTRITDSSLSSTGSTPLQLVPATLPVLADFPILAAASSPPTGN